MAKTDNFEIDKKNNLALVSVNPKIYALNVVFSASYSMLGQAFVVIDGDPESQIVVSLRPRGLKSLATLARNFNNQLLNCAVNSQESKKTASLREQIIRQAFAGHSKK